MDSSHNCLPFQIHALYLEKVGEKTIKSVSTEKTGFSKGIYSLELKK